MPTGRAPAGSSAGRSRKTSLRTATGARSASGTRRSMGWACAPIQRPASSIPRPRAMRRRLPSPERPWPKPPWPSPPVRTDTAAALSGLRSGHQRRQLLRSPRRRAQEPLIERAPFLGEQGELLVGLDPLGDHAEAQRAGHFDDAPDHHPVAPRPAYVLRQPLAELEEIERQRLQISEARIAGAEIVDRGAQAAAAQLGEQRRGRRQILDPPALGDLDRQPLRGGGALAP